MNKQTWPKIRQRKTKVKGSSYTYWIVDCGLIEGKRKTFTFKTKEEATYQAAQIRKDHHNLGVDAIKLTDAQKRDAAAALKELNGRGCLLKAAKFYMRHTSPEGGQRTAGELYQEFIKAKQQSGRRQRTLEDIRHRIGFYVRDFENTPLHEITTHDLDRWLASHEYSGLTLRNFRTHLVSFFNFAKKRKHIKENPAVDLERPIIDSVIPKIMTVKQTEKLMLSAVEHAPEMVPYYAIAIFAGIRPAEVQQLDWSNINFESKSIRVSPETAKKRRQRLVDMSDNLVAWLIPYKQEKGLVAYSRASFDLVKRKAGIGWANDIMRHSYGSYHLAMYENAAKTSLQMGHRSTDILFNHYRDLVSREDAVKFWDIKPRENSNIVRFSATA